MVVTPEEYRKLTGLDIAKALQACPYPDFDMEQEHCPIPVRDVEL